MDDNAITIRSARLSDARAMHKCATAAYAHYIPRMGKPPGPMLEDYAQVVREHDAFVAQAHGELVGFVVLIREGDDVLLDNVAVSPEQQGQGLGKRLIELAEAQARRHGFGSIELYTHECMVENADLYKRLGYTETERKTVTGYKRIYMRKIL